jgi:glycosyltransferase involved in cell wall biosynthesis
VVPSRWPEPFGAIALEAIAAGCVVVASSIGGLVELVLGGSTGLLAPPGDIDRWAATLDTAIHNPTSREQMGRRAAAATIERTVDRVDALVHLSKRPEPPEPSK